MYNYDRTVNEMGHETNEMSHENFEFEWENQEMANEYSHEMPGEYSHEMHGEYSHEMPGEYSHEMHGEYSHEEEMHETGSMNETMEMELAAELLEVQNEAQLEQFLGKLFKKVGRGISAFAKSSAGRAIGGILKKAAKTALPFAGKALGAALGGPLGGMIGGKLGSAASNLFELELEGLSNEDREYEMARAYVRFATDAVRRASRNPRYRSFPSQVARRSVYDAARRWAPGLVRRRRSSTGGDYSSYNDMTNTGGTDFQGSGSWYRQGNQIVLNL